MYNKITKYLRYYFLKGVKIKNRSKNILPSYATTLSSGMDLISNENIIIKPYDIKLVRTGVYIELPKNMEAQVRSRSGLSLKHGISVLNSPGTIDADYRGEIGVILMNNSVVNFEIKIGDRIAQIVFAKVKRIKWKEVKKINNTIRSAGGFGSTGK